MRNFFPKWIAMIAVACVAFVGVGCNPDPDPENNGDGGTGGTPIEIPSREVEIVFSQWNVEDWNDVEPIGQRLELGYVGFVSYYEDPTGVEGRAVLTSQDFAGSHESRILTFEGGYSWEPNEVLATYTEYCGSGRPAVSIALWEIDEEDVDSWQEGAAVAVRDASIGVGLAVAACCLSTGPGCVGCAAGLAVTGILSAIPGLSNWFGGALNSNDTVGNHLTEGGGPPFELEDGRNGAFILQGERDAYSRIWITKNILSGSCP